MRFKYDSEHYYSKCGSLGRPQKLYFFFIPFPKKLSFNKDP